MKDKDKQVRYERFGKLSEETPTYDKMVFLSKKAEEEWNNMSPSVRKTAEHLLNQSVKETQWKIQQEMEAKMMEQGDNHCIEFWRRKAADYEWMFLEQRDIADGYRKIIEEMEQQIKDLKSKKSFDKINCEKGYNMI